MSTRENITARSDSLIELLAAQCADLEQLLALAREETAAATREDFDEIMRIVTERDKISGRLEMHQQQIGEMRSFLGLSGESTARKTLTDRIIETVNLTLLQDARTKALLVSTRERMGNEIHKTDNSRRHLAAYLGEQQKGLAYTGNL